MNFDRQKLYIVEGTFMLAIKRVMERLYTLTMHVCGEYKPEKSNG